jgi:hypothetical protein
MSNEELEFKVAVYENDRINDTEAKVKKENINIPQPTNTRATIGLSKVRNIQYNTDPTIVYSYS